jgi:hypothetical protein
MNVKVFLWHFQINIHTAPRTIGAQHVDITPVTWTVTNVWKLNAYRQTNTSSTVVMETSYQRFYGLPFVRTSRLCPSTCRKTITSKISKRDYETQTNSYVITPVVNPANLNISALFISLLIWTVEKWNGAFSRQLREHSHNTNGCACARKLQAGN